MRGNNIQLHTHAADSAKGPHRHSTSGRRDSIYFQFQTTQFLYWKILGRSFMLQLDETT